MTMSYHMLTSSFLNPTRVSSLCYIRWETTAEPHSFLMLTKPFPAYCYLKALLPMAVAVPSLCWKYLIWKDWHLTFSWLTHFHRETQEGWGWQGPLDHWAQPLLQQGHPEQGAQSHAQVASEDLQGQISTASGQLVPVLHQPHSADVLLGVLSEHLLCDSLAHSLLCRHWVPLRRAQLQPLGIFPSGFCTHCWEINPQLSSQYAEPPGSPSSWSFQRHQHSDYSWAFHKQFLSVRLYYHYTIPLVRMIRFILCDILILLCPCWCLLSLCE